MVLDMIARTVYLTCLLLTLLVALLSLSVGVGFEIALQRAIVALISSSLLGWAALVLLVPKPAEPQEAAAEAAESTTAATAEEASPAAAEGGESAPAMA